MQKVITIKSLKERKNDFQYWQSKTELERLEAIELLRQQYIKFKYPDAGPRFQRICSVIK